MPIRKERNIDEEKYNYDEIHLFSPKFHNKQLKDPVELSKLT